MVDNGGLCYADWYYADSEYMNSPSIDQAIVAPEFPNRNLGHDTENAYRPPSDVKESVSMFKRIALILAAITASPSLSSEIPDIPEECLDPKSVERYDFVTTDGRDLIITLDNGDRKSFPREKMDKGDTLKISYCVAIYYPDFDSVVLMRSVSNNSVPSGENYYWISLDSGKETEIGEEIIFSPENTHIGSGAFGYTDANPKGLVRIWRLSAQGLEEEYHREFKPSDGERLKGVFWSEPESEQLLSFYTEGAYEVHYKDGSWVKKYPIR